jgi:hypothetical protein
MTKTALAITAFVFFAIGFLLAYLIKYFVDFMEWLRDLFE